MVNAAVVFCQLVEVVARGDDTPARFVHAAFPDLLVVFHPPFSVVPHSIF